MAKSHLNNGFYLQKRIFQTRLCARDRYKYWREKRKLPKQMKSRAGYARYAYASQERREVFPKEMPGYCSLYSVTMIILIFFTAPLQANRGIWLLASSTTTRQWNLPPRTDTQWAKSLFEFVWKIIFFLMIYNFKRGSVIYSCINRHWNHRHWKRLVSTVRNCTIFAHCVTVEASLSLSLAVSIIDFALFTLARPQDHEKRVMRTFTQDLLQGHRGFPGQI